MTVEEKMKRLIHKQGHLPKMFNLFNLREIDDVCITLTAYVGHSYSKGGVLIVERKENNSARKLNNGSI